jgi:hypothetical protein
MSLFYDALGINKKTQRLIGLEKKEMARRAGIIVIDDSELQEKRDKLVTNRKEKTKDGTVYAIWRVT